MAYGEGLRFSIGASELKKLINDTYGTKIRSIAKDKSLLNEIAKIWAMYVNNYVPLSADDVPHHLQQYYVSDGRVTWFRKNQNGEDITEFIYEGGKNGNANFVSRYTGHTPQKHWDEAMMPGTDAYDNFLREVAPKIITHFADQLK